MVNKEGHVAVRRLCLDKCIKNRTGRVGLGRICTGRRVLAGRINEFS
jgi:hypothetical protein